MKASFFRWTLVVLAVAGAAFLLVWSQLEEPQPARVRQPAVAQKAPAEPAKAPPEPRAAVILFEFDEAALEPAETAKLDRLAEAMKGAGFNRFGAVGHADRIGAEGYNLELSARRAEAVKAYLVSRGIDPQAVRTYAKGESEPVTGDGCVDMGPETRDNPGLIECLQPDRRVTVAVVGWR